MLSRAAPSSSCRPGTHVTTFPHVLHELSTTWSCGTLDLLHMLQELEAWRISVIAMSGLALLLSRASPSPSGRQLPVNHDGRRLPRLGRHACQPGSGASKAAPRPSPYPRA